MNRIFKNIFFYFLLLFSQFDRAQMCFSVAVNYSVGTTPRGITHNDFNGDGKMDLAFTQYTSNNVTVLLGNGTGSFGVPTNFSVGLYPVSVTSADYNNDGNIDLATSNVSSNDVSVLLGNGAGSFATAINFSTGINPYTVISADFNKDGNMDLGTANDNSSNVGILMGNGTGSFAATTYYTVGGYPYCLTTADFNNDNKLDIATSNAGSGNISVIFGNGTGGFGSATTFTGGLGAFSIISADLSSNGEVDIIISNFYSASISVLLGSGTGGFATAVNFTATLYPYSITSADLNNDGRIDLATTNEGSGNTSILLNNSPPVTINASSNAVCIGNTVTLSGNGANTYMWTGGVTNGVAFTPSATIKYFVTGTNTITNCSYAAAKTITVNLLPGVSVATSNSMICSGQTATLTLSGTAITYSLNSIATTTIVPVSPASTTIYTISGTDVNGCSNTATITQNVSLCTAIANLTEIQNSLFSVYPNPNDGTFMITSEIKTQFISGNMIEIFDLIGERVYENKMPDHKLYIDLKDLKKGIYFCRLVSPENAIFIRKIVIN